MPKRSPIALNPQEHREDAPPAWLEVQDGLADACGLALLLVDGHQPPAIAVSNNNSICEAFQTSSEYATLCDPYCGAAHSKATKAGGTIEYECHAGLRCFAKPVEIGSAKRKLAVIGGRAFVKSTDYHRLMERFRSGDLQSLATSEDVFSNILFAEQQRLNECAERLDKSAHRFRAAGSNGAAITLVKPATKEKAPREEKPKPEESRPQPELEKEVQRLRHELVVSFEVVDIDHQEAHRIVVALGAVQFFREAFFEITSIRQARERVGDRHQLKFGGALLPLRAFQCNRHLRSDDIHQAQIDFVKPATTLLVRDIEDADFTPADNDRVTDE